jgi:NAD(P)H-hydrate epimerase
VLAVDLPSGLDADTGAELGAAVRAAVTVTLVARKPGLALGRGPELAGRVVVAEIGIPRAWLAPAGRS